MMSDEQMDALIDGMRPDLKKAIRSIINGNLADWFPFGEGAVSGETIVLFLAREAPAAVLESTLKGLATFNEIAIRMSQEYAKRTKAS
jgi:hypothetical protein